MSFKVPITFTVDIETAHWIDAAAREAGYNRSAFLRRQTEEARTKAEAGPAQTARDRVEAAFPDPPVRPMKVSRGIPASVVLPSADDDHQYERDDDLPDNVHICWCDVAKHEHHKPANELL